MASRSPVVVLRVPQPMLDTIDRLARAGFVTRAEAMRALMRRQLDADLHHQTVTSYHSSLAASGMNENQDEAA